MKLPHPRAIYEKIFARVLARVTPEASFPEVPAMLAKINSMLKKKKIKAQAVLAGSYAKHTYLKDDFDVDVFVKFLYHLYHDQPIDNLLGEILQPLHPEPIKGSRTYYHIKEGKLLFEIVPVYNIKDPRKAKNVMDMSPLHVHWVRQRMIKKPHLAHEIRLAKVFCKAQRMYGAESYIQGFSGHVLDILVITYGGFLELLAASQTWKEKTVVDPEHHYPSPNAALQALNKAKKVSPLIVIDPLLPSRNAAAALEKEKYILFIEKARAFLEQPSIRFFQKQPLVQKVKKNDPSTVLIRVLPLNKREDVAASKVRRAFEYLKRKIQLYGFKLEQANWEWKPQPIMVFQTKEPLEKIKVIQGPPIKQSYHAKTFKEKYSQAFVKEGRWYAKQTRQFTALRPYVQWLIAHDPHLKELAQNYEVLS